MADLAGTQGAALGLHDTLNLRLPRGDPLVSGFYSHPPGADQPPPALYFKRAASLLVAHAARRDCPALHLAERPHSLVLPDGRNTQLIGQSHRQKIFPFTEFRK